MPMRWSADHRRRWVDRHHHDGVRCDPRVARSRERVIEATIALIREHGGAAVTVEAVAARSGVAKTTIYRQFADREELLFTAFDSLSCPPDVAVSDDLLADVRDWGVGFATSLRSDVFAPLVPALIEAAERSAHGHELAVAFADERREILGRRLRAAVDAGVLSPDLDIDVVCSSLVGPLFYRRFIARRPADARFVDALIRTVLEPHVRPGHTAAGSSSRRLPRK
jgi:AcrR family transcriptional regulator